MEGLDIAGPATPERLRQSIESGIALADELGLALVAIWLEHALQELDAQSDRDRQDGIG